MRRAIALGVLLLAAGGARAQEPRAVTEEERGRYPWLAADARVRVLEEAIPPPAGFHRVPLAEGSFGAWLRRLPLRPAGTPVRAHDGAEILAPGDARLAAVVELDVGRRNLQQCADSVIRLHAEWSWSAGRRDSIAYHFVSGQLAEWRRYAAGERGRLVGRKIAWSRSARPSRTHTTFRAYLDLVFLYGSTRSLARESRAVARADAAPGDFFITPGSPGHVVLILDVAVDGRGRRRALIGQGYMPAQDFHVLSPGDGQAWFSLDGDGVATPFWPAFAWDTLRRL